MSPGFRVRPLSERLNDKEIFPKYGEWKRKPRVGPDWDMYEAVTYGFAYLCNASYSPDKPVVPPFTGKFNMVIASPEGRWSTAKLIFDPPQNWWSRFDSYHESNVVLHNPINLFFPKAYYLIHKYTFIYGHFFMELFPKFWHAYQLDKDLVALFTNCDTFIIDQVFDFFQIPRANYRCIGNKNPVFVAELYMPPPGDLLVLDSEALWAMRKWYLKNHFRRSGPNRYFYMKHFRNREMIGYENLLANISQKYKFIKFEVPILLSIEQQVAHFQNCLIAMGPTGSSFTNLFWMPTNSVVIEFTSDNCYQSTFDPAKLIGLKFLVARFKDSKGRRAATVDIPLVMTMIDNAVEHLRKHFVLE